MPRSTQPIQEPVAIIFHQRPKGTAGVYTLRKLTALLQRFAQKLAKHLPVKTIEVFLDQPKNPVGKPIAFTTMLHVHDAAGSRYVAKARHFVSRAKHVGLETSMRDAMKEIIEQIRRAGGKRRAPRSRAR